MSNKAIVIAEYEEMLRELKAENRLFWKLMLDSRKIDVQKKVTKMIKTKQPSYHILEDLEFFEKVLERLKSKTVDEYKEAILCGIERNIRRLKAKNRKEEKEKDEA